MRRLMRRWRNFSLLSVVGRGGNRAWIFGFAARRSSFSVFELCAARGIFSSAYIYNSLDGALEFFPLAILGVRAGGEVVQNDQDYRAFDCETLKCKGRFYRTYIEGEATAGLGPVFVQGRFRRERWTQKNAADGDFIDPTSAIAMKGSGDSQSVYFGVLGVKLSDAWTALGVFRYAESDRVDGFSRHPYAVLRYRSGRLTAGLGVGVFESSEKLSGFTGLAQIRWSFCRMPWW